KRLPFFLQRIKETGKQAILVTNSDYCLIIVDAAKPKFFEEGTSMCQIDIKTGQKCIGIHKGRVTKGDIFCGGNSDILCEFLRCQGKDILYIGDHIFGDILKSKMEQGWRTFLVIPELINEMSLWIKHSEQYTKMKNLEIELGYTFKHMNLGSLEKTNKTMKHIKEVSNVSKQIDKSYGVFGSLFRHGICVNLLKGTRQSYFANQISRFADLYSHTCLNLLYYPFFYYFRAPLSLMVHEATLNIDDWVDVKSSINMDDADCLQ
ncbi:hypothetical protein HZS_6910, partial [Henneguya salminicola]